MSKVDWITWKTNPKEVINPNIIVENIQNSFSEYNEYMNPLIYDQIKNEIENGILGKDKLSVTGDTPLNRIATDIINKIDDIRYTVEKLEKDAKTSSEIQKQVEKQQLITEISSKIEYEQSTLNQVITNEEMRKHIRNSGGIPEEVIYILEDRINKLKERLEMASSL